MFFLYGGHMLTREMGAWQCVSVAKGTEGFKIDGGYLGASRKLL